MSNIALFVLYFATGVTLCVLYATQSIGPIFEAKLGISATQSVLFTTLAMLPLAIASMIYGYILEKVSIKKLLIIAFLALGGSEISFSLANSYFWLLGIRTIQGLIIPAILTGIMSFISQINSKENVASAIGVYVGVTIIGGLLGRSLSAFMADFFSWRAFFFLLGILLFIVSFLIYNLSPNIQNTVTKLNLKDIFKILKIKHNLYIYIMIGGIFFAFQAILTFIPFELAKLNGGYSGSKTAAVYFGYIIGVIVSFNTKFIVKLAKSPLNAIILGIVLFLVATEMLRFENFFIVLVSMLVFCLGNFVAHSVASGFINKLATAYKGISNGLYISFYYTGGALGSFVPNFIYIGYGWGAFLNLISAVSLISLLFAVALKYEKK